jgi:hypothetical protein
MLKASFSYSVAFNDLIRTHIVELHALLARLETSIQTCANIVDKAQSLANGDDICAVVSNSASAAERCFEVQPHMLSALCDKQLKRYDVFVQGIKDETKQQEDLLEAIQVSFSCHNLH